MSIRKVANLTWTKKERKKNTTKKKQEYLFVLFKMLSINENFFELYAHAHNRECEREWEK